MNHHLVVAIILCSCVLFCAIIFLRGLRKISRAAFPDKKKQSAVLTTTIIGLVVWIVLLGVLSVNGFFADFLHLPPRLPLALLFPLPFVWGITFSATGRTLLQRVPPHWLIYLQLFRIVVEIMLWLSVLWGLLPVQMSFMGRNFDILGGLLALPVGYYCFVTGRWPRVIVLLYNIMGLLLLLNIVSVTFLSMPGPLRVFHNAPDSSLVTQFPFIFLPGFLVPLAYSLHIFSIRQYLRARSAA